MKNYLFKKIFFLPLFFVLTFSFQTKASNQNYLIGVLTKQYEIKECPKTPSDKLKWGNPYYEIGFVPLKSKNSSQFDGFHERIVKAKGKVLGRYDQKNFSKYGLRVVPDQSCGFFQMRSDWVKSPYGTRLLRSVPDSVKEIAEFEPESIEGFSGFQVMPMGSKTVQAGLHNSFSQKLKGIKLIAHYEGCYKKGMPKTVESKPTDIKTNKIFSKRFNIVLKENLKGSKSKVVYLLNSIQVVSDDPNVFFDLDWPIQKALKTPKCEDIKR